MAEPEEKILTQIETFELDFEEELPKEEVSEQFDFATLVDSIGKYNFESIFLSIINEIKASPVEKQKTLCFSIFSKIKEIYDYEFSPYPEIENQDDFNEVYELISFIEYNNISFLSDVWKFLDEDLRKLDVGNYSKENYKQIIKEIDEQVDISNMGKITKTFLRTYSKEGIIGWFVRETEQSRMLIILRILEGENNG